MKTLPLACPIDRLPLDNIGTSLRCSANHVFDFSRDGYANLLPVQFKSSKDPGDSKVMVAARRRVLQSGLFDNFADEVARLTQKLLCDITDTEELPLVVDAGCGEGFYLDHLNTALNASTPICNLLGTDISKWAITAAAKRFKNLNWVVAANTRLPVIVGKAPIIISLFGFETWKPWSTLQLPGQWVITLDAGANHLIELRELIYDEVLVHDPAEPGMATQAGYTMDSTKVCNYQKQIDNPNLLIDIISMTPHAHRAKESRIKELRKVAQLSLTFEAVLRIHRLSPKLATNTVTKNTASP